MPNTTLRGLMFGFLRVFDVENMLALREEVPSRKTTQDIERPRKSSICRLYISKGFSRCVSNCWSANATTSFRPKK